MSWSLGYDPNWCRDIGYGVPAVCDEPDCTKGIDRGLAHVCGGEPFGGDQGCGLHFCSEHLVHGGAGHRVCRQCRHGQPAFQPKPDTREWVEWKLTDPSWAEWRDAEPRQVEALRVSLSPSTVEAGGTPSPALRSGGDRE